MTQPKQTEPLPPFVIEDKETGERRVQLKALPDGLFNAILADNSREGAEGSPEWYKLRTGVTALRMVRMEVASGVHGAEEALNDPTSWLSRMPADWEEYIQPHLQPDQSSQG